jgi:hypothetical protein
MNELSPHEGIRGEIICTLDDFFSQDIGLIDHQFFNNFLLKFEMTDD